jgi:lysophospholipase L1-like esterase
MEIAPDRTVARPRVRAIRILVFVLLPLTPAILWPHLIFRSLVSPVYCLHPRTCEPAPRTELEAIARAAEISNNFKPGTHRILFIGDSIAHGWILEKDSRGKERGKPIWDEAIAPIGGYNLGIRRDRIEHVLFRLREYKLIDSADNVEKVVLMIGTNNVGAGHSECEIVKGIVNLVELLQTDEFAPNATIYVYNLFPRNGTNVSAPLWWERFQESFWWSRNPNAHNNIDALMSKTKRINRKLEAELDERFEADRVIFVPLFEEFIEGGRLAANFADTLHPSLEGYRIWATSLAKLIPEIEPEIVVQAGRKTPDRPDSG